MENRLLYAIFGAGRVGSNIAGYLQSLGHETRVISHAEAAGVAPQGRSALVAGADIVAAAIPDGALGAWSEDWRAAIGGRPAIHFSGALLVEGLWSYHPLYSFPPTPLAPEALRAILFARQEGAPPLSEIMPGAPNPEIAIADADRAFYHALAVLSGNFAAHLWNETAQAFAARIPAAPEAALAGYLAGVVDRFRESPSASLTGPLARRDAETVRANLAALEREPRLTALYRSFLASAWPDFEQAG